MTQRIMLQGLTAVGLQTMSLANSTAVALNSTAQTAQIFDISVETQAVRMRADGTDPTLNTGVLIATGFYRMYYLPPTAVFQRSTGTVTVSLQGYKHYTGLT